MANRLNKKFFGISMIMISILVGAYGLFIRHEYKRLQPPKFAEHLSDFQSMPNPHRLALVKVSDDHCYVWIGETASLLILPSGPSCYVFDADGRLIDWTSDSGESRPMGHLCSLAWKNTPISLTDAISQTTEQK